MIELLTVIALRQAIFVSVSLYFEVYMAEARQLKDALRLLSPRKGDEEKWEIGLSGIFGGRPAGGCHLPDAGYIEAQIHQRFESFPGRRVGAQVPYYGPYRFQGFWEKRVEFQVIL
jgi:hypothetical protein